MPGEVAEPPAPGHQQGGGRYEERVLAEGHAKTKKWSSSQLLPGDGERHQEPLERHAQVEQEHLEQDLVQGITRPGVLKEYMNGWSGARPPTRRRAAFRRGAWRGDQQGESSEKTRESFRAGRRAEGGERDGDGEPRYGPDTSRAPMRMSWRRT